MPNDFIFILFIVVVGIQFIYYILLFSKFAFTSSKNIQTSDLPVSVIVCAKNESRNLPILIPKLINQHYNNFEIVLINDCSTDNTLEIITHFQKAHQNITVVDVKENEHFWGNKKYALTLGIKASKYEHLVFIDADCVPATDTWLKSMTHKFSLEKQIVLGYGAYSMIEKSFLNKIIRFETLLTALQYFSFAKIGLPYMGVGRNLAYTKKLFYKVNGFAKHMHIKSGDDDLFINEAATNKNTVCNYNSEGFTYSEPKKTFKSWIRQKRRHLETANYYKLYQKYILGIFYSSQLLFWVLAIYLMAIDYNLLDISILIIFRFFITYLILGLTAKKLKENDLIFFIPVYELFLIGIQFYLFIRNKISKPTQW